MASGQVGMERLGGQVENSAMGSNLAERTSEPLSKLTYVVQLKSSGRVTVRAHEVNRDGDDLNIHGAWLILQDGCNNSA